MPTHTAKTVMHAEVCVVFEIYFNRRVIKVVNLKDGHIYPYKAMVNYASDINKGLQDLYI